MKQIVATAAVIVFFASVSYAQKDTAFYKHEIRASLGEATNTSWFRFDDANFTNISVSYFYRPAKFFWAGLNFVNYIGERTHYNWREYDIDGKFNDFSQSKIKYCAFIAPEIRLSCLNMQAIIIYGGLSVGIGIENGFDSRHKKYPYIFRSSHLTLFGISGNLGKNNNIVIGGELGVGFKGLASAHAGYRF